MSAFILTGAAGSGKTATLIDNLLAVLGAPGLPEVWVLLPTRLQIEAFRTRLLERAGQTALFNLRFFEFYELYATLLDMGGIPQRTIGRAASDRILRAAIQHVQAEGDLRYYTDIADKSGFVRLMGDFVRELKQGVVRLEDFQRVALRRGAKDQDINQIYHYYQNFLNESALVDRDGAGWVALEALRNNPTLIQQVEQISLLAVDGYDQFTPLQAALLAELANRIPDLCITLSYEAHRSHDAGRTAHNTLKRLHKYRQWEVRQHPRSEVDGRQPPLRHLERQLYTLNPAAEAAVDCLVLIEAPDAQSEARAVMREVKKLLLEGVLPDKIALVMRQSAPYLDALRGAADAYGIPAAIRQEERVLDNPAVVAVLALLDLHQGDFARRPLLDSLHSPYLQAPDLSAEDIAALERESLERLIIGGRERWLSTLHQAAPPRVDEEEESAEASSIPAGLAERLERFLDRITPPETASARTYALWIENLLGPDPVYLARIRADIQNPDADADSSTPDHLNLYQQVRGEAAPEIIVRDMYALQGLRSALAEVVSAYDLLVTDAAIPWSVFRADLELALSQRTVRNRHEGIRAGRVLMTTVHEARGLPHDYVFVLGLAEGVFPARQSEDPLYSDRERGELASVIDIQTAEERANDSSLFYEMCALARRCLYLSRPTVDERGNPWQESIFWKNALALLSDAQLIHIPVGAPPTLETAASPREAAIALAAALNRPPHDILPQIWGAMRWMQSQPLWDNLRAGRAIETARESHRLNQYSGMLSDEALIAEAATYLSEGHLWSASQFNDLSYCGFRFFSKRLLKLERYEEPEAGLDVMQLGSVQHAIFERTYQRLADEGLSIAPENLTTAQEFLREEAALVFASAPQVYGFEASPLWQQEQQNMLDAMRRLLALDFSEDSPVNKHFPSQTRQPYYQEAAFGAEGNPPVRLEGSAGVLLARGYIDRADLLDGRRLVVMDYKSGGVPSVKDMQGGRNYQMLLYLRAAEQLFPAHTIEGGLFWSISNPAKTTSLEADDAAIEQAFALLHERVLAGRDGQFPSVPASPEKDGKCVRYCEFSQMCRTQGKIFTGSS